MKKIISIILFVLAASSINLCLGGQSPEPKVQEHLGAKIPLNLTFKDENGKSIKLSNIFTRSTVVAFVYYRCPGLCDPLMTEIANVINKVNLEPGIDYDVVSISMDDRETTLEAKKKKEIFTSMITRYFPDSAWRFLTGDSVTIKKATDAAGFYFKRVDNGFIHTSVLIFVSKDGKICRYLYPALTSKKKFGILPFDFEMANMETAQGKEVPVVGKLIQFCFSYDPQGKTYTIDLLKIFGAGVLFFTAIFVVFVLVKPKKEKSK
jgi:protein SCO1/2